MQAAFCSSLSALFCSAIEKIPQPTIPVKKAIGINTLKRSVIISLIVLTFRKNNKGKQNSINKETETIRNHIKGIALLVSAHKIECQANPD